MTVRVRFAPSPTGSPHVGSAHTALFNWLFARHNGGTFILRIEDTDVERKVEHAVDEILDGLRWLGLDWDEGPEVGGPYGPYIQSERLPLYHQAAQQLLASGAAYYCYCSEERLEALRQAQLRAKLAPGYDRRCRNLTEAERREFEASGITPVVRFRSPLEGKTTFHDYLRGAITVENRTLDDFIILKSDGFPTYHLASVVDDHAMEISHVIRAEEWLPSTPRHLLLYRAFGYEPPIFVHLPLILAPDRSKLSKRHGAVSLQEFREEGYLPEALVNYLALLGWSLDDKTEIIGRDDLIKHFTLERVGKTPGIFNYEKLRWMNGVYIRQMDHDRLTSLLVPFLESGLPPSVPRPLDVGYVRAIVPLIYERLRVLREVAELTEFFFVEEFEYPPTMLLERGLSLEQAQGALAAAIALVEAIPTFQAEDLETSFRAKAAELGLTTGSFFGLLRVALTGRTVAPPLFQTMAVLGRERCLRRLRHAVHQLAHAAA